MISQVPKISSQDPKTNARTRCGISSVIGGMEDAQSKNRHSNSTYCRVYTRCIAFGKPSLDPEPTLQVPDMPYHNSLYLYEETGIVSRSW